jgi:hypothetical protein
MAGGSPDHHLDRVGHRLGDRFGSAALICINAGLELMLLKGGNGKVEERLS